MFDSRLSKKVQDCGTLLAKAQLLLCLLVLWNQILACPMAKAETTRRDPNQLIAVIPRDAPPTYYQDTQTGTPRGFAVDLANEVAKEAGFSLSYIFANNWDEIQQILQRGDADLMPGLSVSADRQATYAFSQPFDIFTISYFVRSGSDILQLKVKAEVGAIRGSVAAELLLPKPDIHLIPYENFETGLFDLLSGKIDSFACPAPVLWRLAMDSGVERQIAISGKAIAEVKRAFGVRKDRTDLIKRLDSVLDSLIGSPTYQAIYTKWYGKPKHYFTLTKHNLWLTIVSTLIIIALAAWRHYSLLVVKNQLQRESLTREKATLALQDSEERLSLALTATQQAWFDLDIPSGEVSVSDEFPRLLGFSPEGFHSNLQEWIDGLHPDDRDAALQVFHECLATEKTLSTEYRHRTNSGSYVWLRSTGKVVSFTTDHTPLRMIGTHVDISLYKQTEQALQESEARYRELFEAESDAIFLIDNESGQILEANAAAATLYGYDKAELLTKKNTDISAEPENTKRRTKDAAKHINQVIYIPLRLHRKKDGTIFLVEITGRSCLLQGRSVHIIAIRDMTERQQAEAALKESEERFRKLLQHVPSVAVQGYRLDGTTQYWNDASEKIYGYTAQEAIGQNLLNLIIPPEMQDATREALQQMALSGVPAPSSELSLMRKDGSRVAVYSSHGLVCGSGCESELFCLDVDLSAIKASEEQLLRAIREKEVLIKEVHHRVKNNMQVIYSLLNLQAKGINDPRIRGMFEESRNRVNSMALIHQKLYQSKDLALINFKEYLQSLTQEIAATYNRPEIQLLVVMEPGLALDVNAGIPCGLIANELISNAFKHAFPEGRKGSIQVGLHCEGEDIFVLTIADDGIGFPPGLDFRNTPSLGLQLVNVLTGQLHGTIDLNTEQETSFRIRFPASQQAGDKHNG